MTGAGSLSAPLALSPGRSGFGPRLSVEYDSGNGNGVFGVGWRLSLPSITRRTDKGLPQYRDSDESDIFILSGAEDLVPVLLREDEGRLRLDEFERDGYRVKRYRPRIEGLFAKIERWTCIESGEAHWRSLSKDNILTVYGLDAASRIADPEDPQHVFSWLICRSYDDKGNAIVYDYVAEDDRGVDLAAPSEQRRVRDGEPLSEADPLRQSACRSSSIRNGRASVARISSRTISRRRAGCSKLSSTTGRDTTGSHPRMAKGGFARTPRPAPQPPGRCEAIRSPPIVPDSRFGRTGSAGGCSCSITFPRSWERKPASSARQHSNIGRSRSAPSWSGSCSPAIGGAGISRYLTRSLPPLDLVYTKPARGRRIRGLSAVRR